MAAASGLPDGLSVVFQGLRASLCGRKLLHFLWGEPASDSQGSTPSLRRPGLTHPRLFPRALCPGSRVESERIRTRAFQCFVLNCLLFIGSLCVMEYMIMPIILYVRTLRQRPPKPPSPPEACLRCVHPLTRAHWHGPFPRAAAASQPDDEQHAAASAAYPHSLVSAALGLPGLLHLLPRLVLVV
jgi:hypothetical protein